MLPLQSLGAVEPPMGDVRSIRSRIATYGAWLVFVGALLVAPNLIAVNNIVRTYRLSWLDVFATGALLFGPALLIVSAAGGTVLALIEAITARSRSQRLRVLPACGALTIFLAAWLQLLGRTLKINKVELAWLNRPFEIPVAVAIAGLLFVFAPAAIAQWVTSTGARVRLVSAALTVALVGLLGYTLIDSLYRGARGPVQLPARDQPRPNVIVVVLDGLTTQDMSLYGYHLPTTPRLDEITKTWTVFENAHAAGTATMAALPTILTGRYPLMNAWYQYGDRARAGQGVLSLPRILQASGYETIYAMGGGWPASLYHLQTGFDRIMGVGFPAFGREQDFINAFPGRELLNRTVWNPTIAEALLPRKTGPQPDQPNAFDEPMYDRVADLFREHARRAATTPFFVYMHNVRPHPPYFANELMGRFLPLEAGMADARSQNPLIHQPYTPEAQGQIDKLRLRYDEHILKADQQVGHLVDTLKQTGLYENSLIVVTADHGTSFTGGVQGYFSLQVRAAEHWVPLLVKFPGQTRGRRVDSAVSLVDILPTALDVVGATYPAGWTDGQSLHTAEQHPERTVYVTRLHTVATLDFDRVAAIRGPLKLVRRNKQELLFKLADDPDEKTNLLMRRPAPDLRAALDQFRRRAAFMDAGGRFDEAPVLP